MWYNLPLSKKVLEAINSIIDLLKEKYVTEYGYRNGSVKIEGEVIL